MPGTLKGTRALEKELLSDQRKKSPRWFYMIVPESREASNTWPGGFPGGQSLRLHAAIAG